MGVGLRGRCDRDATHRCECLNQWVTGSGLKPGCLANLDHPTTALSTISSPFASTPPVAMRHTW